ncbi:MAG: His-Xaa-Ser system radical SAM maturase HxsB [Patescibacteria group bacterium]|nr:His-Xaa-Ser system radical SAM maturase HxsB [Patescibacteria group bacterium]
MNFDLKKIKCNKLTPFYFKKIKGGFLLTNDFGGWLVLPEEKFNNVLAGSFKKDKDLYGALKSGNFLKKEIDLERLSKEYNLRNEYLFFGPSLHIIILTQRCNQKCIYCHASAKDILKDEFDMNKTTAKNIVDKIFESPANDLTIEFQGGEPLLNWPILKFIIEYAKKLSASKGKKVWFKLISNFSLMNEKRFKYLLDNMVGLSISLDGPENLHNKQRIFIGGNGYKNAKKWITRFYKIYPKIVKKGYIYRIGGIVTITRLSLPYYKEIIDEYLKLGFTDIYVRPMNPFGFSKNNWKKLGYNAKEYMGFYKKLLSYIIELNLSGKKFREKTALVFLRKILTNEDPMHTEYRSPCGAVVGQMAYDYNGDIYTCDEGRMIGMMGDDNFKLGNVFENSYNEIIESPVTKTMCLASCLDGLVGCSDCVFKPYCGVCPIYNYFQCGNLFSQIANNDRCKISKGILDFIFKKLQKGRVKKIFQEWTDVRFFSEVK